MPVVAVAFPVTLLKTPPVPVVLTCHCTVGVGLPDAVAVNETAAPDVPVWFIGLVVIVGEVGEAACEGYPFHVGVLNPVAPLK